jgi:hypothetical protein
MLKNLNFVKMIFQHDLVFDIHSNHSCFRHLNICLCAEKQRVWRYLGFEGQVCRS